MPGRAALMVAAEAAIQPLPALTVVLTSVSIFADAACAFEVTKRIARPPQLLTRVSIFYARRYFLRA